jgi:hypothetical protein
MDLLLAGQFPTRRVTSEFAMIQEWSEFAKLSPEQWKWVAADPALEEPA